MKAVKNRRKGYVLLVCLLFIVACIAVIQQLSSFNPNLVRNGSFEVWDTLNFPVGWEMDEIYNYRAMLSPSLHAYEGDTSLSMERNGPGQHLLFQKVRVEQNTIYKLEAKVSGTIQNYAPGGIEVFSSEGAPLGKHHIMNCQLDNYKQLSVKFNSGEADSIIVSIGFRTGMQASLILDDVVLRKSKSADLSPVAEILSDYMNLQDFNEHTFDANIEKISSKLNWMLIDGYKSFLSTNNESFLRESDTLKTRFIKDFSALQSDPYLAESFTLPSSLMPYAYCQRTSLVHSKILEYFKIATRQIHWHKDGVGFHQFLEYWNPYKRKWVILDPFFGVKYAADSTDLGSKELKILIDNKQFNNNLIRRVDVGEFYFSEEDIMKGWQDKVQIQPFGDLRLSLQ